MARNRNELSLLANSTANAALQVLGLRDKKATPSQRNDTKNEITHSVDEGAIGTGPLTLEQLARRLTLFVNNAV